MGSDPILRRCPNPLHNCSGWAHLARETKANTFAFVSRTGRFAPAGFLARGGRFPASAERGAQATRGVNAAKRGCKRADRGHGGGLGLCFCGSWLGAKRVEVEVTCTCTAVVRVLYVYSLRVFWTENGYY